MRSWLRAFPATARKRLASALLVWTCLAGGSAWSQEGGVEASALEAARSAEGEEAVKRYQALAAKHPHSVMVQYELAEARYDTQDYKAALEAFQKTAALGKKDVRVLTRIGQCHAKLKLHGEAHAAFSEALKLAPDSHVVQFNLGAALFNLDKPKEALPCFETIKNRADDWGAYAREYLAYCTYDLQRYQETIDVLLPLLERNPNDPGLRWLLAKSLYKSNRYAEARIELEKVASENPKQALGAKFYLAACLEGLGKKREAERAYEALGKEGDSEWSKTARKAAQTLAGKPYRFFLDFLTGYDTGLLLPGDENISIGGKDAFTQQYLLLEGRVFRTQGFSLWLGGEHFGLHYPDLHGNDYFEDTPSITFKFPEVGPFTELSFRYHFKYAQLDYQSYLREHQLTFQADYKKGDDRFGFGGHYGENDYFRRADGLTGPDAQFFIDYRRKLPAWDHELRLRANVDYRWSQLESAERFSQRVRLKYEARILERLTGFLESTYRRDDYPNSQSGAGFLKRRHRTDHRLKGEVRFEYMIHPHFFVNWGYQYESQDSRSEVQEYGRHQMDGGFTVSF